MWKVNTGGTKKKIPTQRRQRGGEEIRPATHEHRQQHHGRKINQRHRLIADPALNRQIPAASRWPRRPARPDIVSLGLEAEQRRADGACRIPVCPRARRARPRRRCFDEPLQHGATAPGFEPARTARLADDDLRDVLLARHAQQAAHQVFVRGGDDFRAEFAGGGEILFQLAPARLPSAVADSPHAPRASGSASHRPCGASSG